MNLVIPYVFQVFPEHGEAPAAPASRPVHLREACSDTESPDGFIEAHQKKTEVIDEKLFKSYQVFPY